MTGNKEKEKILCRSDLIQDADYIPSGEVIDTPWVRPHRERNITVEAMAPICVILAGLVLAVGWRSMMDPGQTSESASVRQIADSTQILFGSPGDCSQLGVSARTVSGPAAVYYTARDDALVPGAQIYDVRKGGAAEKAGLQSGDIITAMDDRTISTEEELIRAAENLGSGETAALTVYRSGKFLTVEMTFP